MFRIVSLCLIFISSITYGQELVEKTKKYTGSKKTLAKYHVLKKKKRIKQGAYKVFNLDGSLNHTGWCNNNMKDSIWHFYGPGEVILIEGRYQDNMKNGEWKYYWDNGTIESIGYFKDCLETGHWKYFNEDGLLIGEGEFKEGNEVENSFKYYDLAGNTLKKIQTINDSTEHSLAMTTNDIELSNNTFPAQVYFRHGDDALRKYLFINATPIFDVPSWQDSGAVRVIFVVKPNGKLEVIDILEGYSEYNDQKIEKLLKEMPRWRPSTNNGLPINTTYIYQYEYMLGTIFF